MKSQYETLKNRELNNLELANKFRASCNAITDTKEAIRLWNIADHRLDSDLYFDIWRECSFVRNMPTTTRAKSVDDLKIRRVRRRIEDYLRKIDNATILKVAGTMSIKVD